MVYRRSICSLLLAALLWISSGAAQPARAQDPGLLARLLAAINGYRVSSGLPPYALNPLLTLSAQRHSQYQASIGQWSHDEPDGSRALQRAQAVGYPAIRANENVYAGGTSPEEVVNWWFTTDQDHRNNILHPVLREVGLGIAPDAQGQLYWTMDISAQPNVLPIFINSDAYSTSNPNVTLTLWNEGVFYGGGQIGQATQVMISNSPDLNGAVWQPWAQNIPWTLDTSTGGGSKTVYVRFIDSPGITADSQDSILYDGEADSVPPLLPPIVLFPTLAPTQPPATFQPQPTAIPAVEASAVPTQIAAVISSPAPPTPDYTIFRATPIPGWQLQDTIQPRLLGIAITRVRDILFGVLAIGVGFITLGTLGLIRSWKRTHSLSSPPEEESTYGDD